MQCAWLVSDHGDGRLLTIRGTWKPLAECWMEDTDLLRFDTEEKAIEFCAKQRSDAKPLYYQFGGMFR